MAKKITSSDKIKELLEKQNPGSGEWKRLSKSGGASGEVLRVFENIGNRTKVTVSEKDGAFTILPDAVMPQAANDNSPREAFNAAAEPEMPPDMSSARVCRIFAQQTKTDYADWAVMKETRDEQTRNVWEIIHLPSGNAYRVTQVDAVKCGVIRIQADNGFLMVSPPREEPPYRDRRTAAEKLAQQQKWEAAQTREAEEKRTGDIGLLAAPIVDADPARNKLADALIKRILSCDDIDEEELKKAGKALANRFGFGIGYNEDWGGDEDEHSAWGTAGNIGIMIAPLEEGWYDQSVSGYIGHLLPKGMDEECEAQFSMEGRHKIMDVAKDLLQRGFAVSAYLQEFADKNGQTIGNEKPLLADLLKLQDKIRNGTAPKASKKTPKP